MSGSGSDAGGSDLHQALRALASQARDLESRQGDGGESDPEEAAQVAELGARLRQLLPGRLVNPVDAASTWVEEDTEAVDSADSLRDLATLSDGLGARSFADAIDRYLADTGGVDLHAAAERYQDEGSLGEGGMGEVRRVYDRRLNRNVAMKVLKHHSGRSDLVSRFAQEAQVTGQLEHPGIVPVHDLGRTAEGALYFTMKEVRGRSLTDEIRRSRESVAAGEVDRKVALVRLVGVLLKVCNAVAFAHSHGVVHRDLKPDNIMVGEFGEVQVMDWGLARVSGASEEVDAGVVSDRDATHSRVGSVTGTPAYMAPEQARGEVDRIGPHTDVWSLGATLYEVLAGERAFQGVVDDILQAVREGVVVPPSERAEVPRELEAIALRAMAADPADRYPEVGALETDLRAWVEGRPLETLQYTSAELLNKWVRRNRATVTVALITGGLAAALILGLAVKYVVDLDRAADIAQAEAQRAREAEAEVRLTLAESRVATADALSATGRFTEARDLYRQAMAELAEAGQPTLGPRMGLWTVYHRTHPPLGPFAPSVGEVTRVVPHPDGDRALVQGAGGTLAEVELPTGRVRSWWDVGDPPEEVAWEPTGPVAWVLRDEGPMRRLVRDDLGRGVAEPLFAVSHEHRTLRRVQGSDAWLVTDQEITWLMRPEDGDWERVDVGRGVAAWAAEGRAILSTYGEDTWLWDLEAVERVRRLSPHFARLAVSPDQTLVALGVESTREVVVQRLDTGETLWREPRRSAAMLAFDASEERVYAAGMDPGVDVFDSRTGEHLARLEGHHQATRDIAGMGDLVVTTGREGESLLWTAPAGRRWGEVLHREARDAALSADGRLVALAAHDHVEVWDAATGLFLAGFPTHRRDAWSVAFSPASSRLVVTFRSDTPVVVDLPGGQVHPVPVGGVISAAFVDDGRLALGTRDGRVGVWDAGTMEPVWSKLGAHEGVVWSLHPAGEVLYSVGFDDGTARAWSADTGEARATFPRESLAYQVDVTRDGARVAVGSYDRVAALWPAAGSEAPALILDDHQGPVLDVGFSPDGRWLATGEWSWKLRFFDAATGAVACVDTAHDGPIGSLWWPVDEEILTYGDDGWLIRRDLGLDGDLTAAAAELRAVASSPAGPLSAEDAARLAEVFSLHGAHARAAESWQRAREAGGEAPPLREAQAWWRAGRPDLALEQAADLPDTTYAALFRARLRADAGFPDASDR